MKPILALFLVLGLSSSALAVSKGSLDKRILKLTQKFVELQSDAQKRIPAATLREAKGIALLDRTKAGFIFAYQGGSGVAMVRDKDSGQWGPPAFLKANEASLGFLIGGQQSFMVILFMTPEAAQALTGSTFNFGGEARGTAGESSAGAEGTVTDQTPAVLVYDNREGLYGGAAIKGGAVSPDNDANMDYYDEAVTMDDILFKHKVNPTPRAKELAEKIEDYAKATKE